MKLTTNMIVGFFFVSVIGSLWHFIYKWTGNNVIIGFFAPINESTFEHMKLVFFPRLLYLPISIHFLKDDYAEIKYSFSYGILASTIFLPIFFYSYSGILGRNYMAIDIGSFFVAVFILFYTTYQLLTSKETIGKLGYYMLYIFALLFICLTYLNSGEGIFAVG